MTTQAPTSFSLTTPLFLEEIAKELLQKPKRRLEFIVGRICDRILDDLDGLCDLFKKSGERGFEQLRETTISSWVDWNQGTGETYVGLGLGNGFLGLGFLENDVVTALKVRFIKMGASVTKISKSGSTTTYSTSGELYATSKGTYAIIHTHSWFIKKRID